MAFKAPSGTQNLLRHQPQSHVFCYLAELVGIMPMVNSSTLVHAFATHDNGSDFAVFGFIIEVYGATAGTFDHLGS